MRKIIASTIAIAFLLSIMWISGNMAPRAQAQDPVLTVGAFDPCLAPGVKSSVAINITTATTTQLIGLAAGKKDYVCGGSLVIATSATTADTAQFEFGTGASCGTGTTALTGQLGAGDVVANTAITVTLEPNQNFQVPLANAVCLVTAGTTVNVQGWLTFIQQ